MEKPRLIEIKRYGSEGWIPANSGLKMCKHEGQNSCVSGSGDSICGGFEGKIESMGRDWAVCTEDSLKAWLRFCAKPRNPE
jgi:hypothetical protein